MKKNHATFGLLLVFSVGLLMVTKPDQTLTAFQEDNVTILDSPIVCSPFTHPTCMPGPYGIPVEVPEAANQARIDVYWVKTGASQIAQPNEHSWFSASTNGVKAGEVYCPDFGDELGEPEFCGSVEVDVSVVSILTLTIVHADETVGPTPGSHRQHWEIHWLPAVSPPLDTLTPTPVTTETQTATPTTTASATFTSTPTLISSPLPSATGTLPTPGETVPTQTSTAIPPTPSLVPASETPLLPVTLPPPSRPTAGLTPAVLIPVTGAGEVGTSGSEPTRMPAARLIMFALGIGLVSYGFWRSRRRS